MSGTTEEGRSSPEAAASGVVAPPPTGERVSPRSQVDSTEAAARAVGLTVNCDRARDSDGAWRSPRQANGVAAAAPAPSSAPARHCPGTRLRAGTVGEAGEELRAKQRSQRKGHGRRRARSIALEDPTSGASIAPAIVRHHITPPPTPDRAPLVFDSVKTCMGLDIGGTQAKLVIFFSDEDESSAKVRDDPIKKFVRGNNRYGGSGMRDEDLEFHSDTLRGTFVFIRYLSRKTEGAVEMIAQAEQGKGLQRYIHDMHVTGGGAYKYAQVLEDGLGIKFQKSDEMETLVKGLCFLAEHAPDEIYTCTRVKFGEEVKTVPVEFPSYPFLIVNIGSGVSIIKVDGPDTFERVSGTALGGGTMFGLARMLTGAESFEDAMQLAEGGDAKHVNQLVRDIYGGDYEAGGLPGSLTASFFGKVCQSEETDEYRPEDTCRALTVMLSQNITQIAYLNAKLHATRNVFFTGGFLRNNKIAVRTLTFTMNAWAKGEVQPLFLRHESYFGSMGAFLDTLLGSKKAMQEPTNAALVAATVSVRDRGRVAAAAAAKARSEAEAVAAAGAAMDAGAGAPVQGGEATGAGAGAGAGSS